MANFSSQSANVSRTAGKIDSHNVDTESSEPVHGADEEPSAIVTDDVAGMSKDALDAEAFYAQEVEVAFTEPIDENEPQFVECTVNGHYVCARRDGNPIKMRRYHLEVIARAKQGRLRQKKIVNSDGSMGYQEQIVLSLSYPFQVFADPAGKRGAEWLRSLLKMPG